MTRIDVYTEGVRLPFQGVTRRMIRTIAMETAALLAMTNATISIIVCDNAFMREMNRKFRSLDEPTDVISFSNRESPFPELETDLDEIGDIFISAERTLAQSCEYRVSFTDEMKRLIVHGMLHLAGYDHERSDRDERIMLQKEEEICSSIQL
ncbi:MAG: rRNA maturation RNase YbeY [Spirochaetes bacterium]|nr:rRNA maturation RNase YbeY [Spirochaetota bacterium]